VVSKREAADREDLQHGIFWGTKKSADENSSGSCGSNSYRRSQIARSSQKRRTIVGHLNKIFGKSSAKHRNHRDFYMKK
jgi:hypothetical protein